MATTSLQNFLAGLTSAATGYLQGQQQGEQQRRADDLQSFQMLHQLGAEQQWQQDQQRQFLASQVPHLDPSAQPQAVQELANFKPAANPVGISAFQDLRAGKGLPSFTAAAGTAAPSPVTPPPSPAPIPFGKAGSPEVSPALVAAGSAPPVAPGTPPPTATGTPGVARNPRTVNFPLGGKQVALAYGSTVPKGLSQQITNRYKALQQIRANLAPGSPAAAAIDRALAPAGDVINLDPQDETTANESLRRLFQAEQATAGQGIARQRLTAGILDRGPRGLTEYFNQLPQGDTGALIAGLGQAADEARSLQANATTVGGHALLPQLLAENLEDIDKIRQMAASGDPAQMQQAQDMAEDIGSRIKAGMTVPQQLEAMGHFLKLTARFSPYDPGYEAQVAKAAKDTGVASFMTPGPDGKYHLGGAVVDRAWSSWQNKMIAAAKLDPKSQRVILDEGRRLAKMQGVDPNTIPEVLKTQMTPLQQAQLTKTNNENDVFYTNEERKAAQAQREQQLFDANYARLKAKPAGNGINAAQTLENLYKSWQTKQKQYDAELKAGGLLTDNDIDGGTGSILSVADRKTFKQKRAAVQKLEHNYKAYFNQVQYVPGQAGGGTAGTGAAGGGTTAPKRSRSEMAAFLRQRYPTAAPAKLTHWLNTHGY